MATTNLFVELLVIGVGAACWVGLLLLAAFGIDVVEPELLKSYSMLPGLLAIVYVMGIVSDRAADVVFDKLFSTPLRKKHFHDTREYQDARREIFSSSDRLAEMHEYGRTRIRICRGWALNSALIAIALNIFLAARCREQDWYTDVALYGTTAIVLLSSACWWSWRMLCVTEYLKIREHAEFLKRQTPRPRVRRAA